MCERICTLPRPRSKPANKSAQASSVEVQTALTVPCRCKAAGNKKERFDAARWCRVRIPFVDPPAMRTNNAIKTGLSFSGQANMLRLFSRSANVRDAFRSNSWHWQT